MKAWLLALLLSLAGVALATPPLKVASYNLRLNDAGDGPNAWPHRREQVQALIRYHRLDLVATQEGLIDQIRDLEAMPRWARVGVGRDDGREGGEHSAIFFRRDRLALEDHGDFWLSATPEKPSMSWDSNCCHRLATWARLRDRASGQRFIAFSVHFDHEAAVSRRESARLLVERVKALSQGLPVLCLGDFNATPDSEPVAIMRGALRDARELSETPPYGPVGTFNAFRWDAAADERIDYLFVSPGVRVLDYAVLTDSLRGRYTSDHFPLVVTVKWKKLDPSAGSQKTS
ncbi:MAG: endonuclease/exonuclease/phosphatase family protein [Burkholderiales bacterium]|nr:endonuclease/exonuclease/phosphatase family protein [Burkholderiales bacterium]